MRQAPPDIYLPFISSDDEYDAGRECEKIGKEGVAFILCIVVVYAVVVCWRGIRSIF